jgi:hypothetical protein
MLFRERLDKISKYVLVLASVLLVVGLWPTNSSAAGCSWWEFWCEDTPTSEDIINAVRRSVSGKTYTVSTTKQERKAHYCGQKDNSGRCPYAGAIYYTYAGVPVRETRTCNPLPEPQFGWSVQTAGEDRWRVINSGSAWDVEKTDGSATQAGELIRISRFAFRIHPHQDC